MLLRVCILACSLVPCLTLAESLRYIKQQHGQEQVMLWELASSGNEWLIEASENDRLFRNYCVDSGETVRWEVTGDTVSIKAYLIEDEVLLEGKTGQQTVSAKKKLHGLPWFQPLSFSLARFLESDSEQIVFWMIRPDNFSFVKMQARREGAEFLQNAGGRIAVQRVSVRPTGVLSLMWQANYWFAQTDRKFLKYESSGAIPGVAEATVQLDTLM